MEFTLLELFFAALALTTLISLGYLPFLKIPLALRLSSFFIFFMGNPFSLPSFRSANRSQCHTVLAAADTLKPNDSFPFALSVEERKDNAPPLVRILWKQLTSIAQAQPGRYSCVAKEQKKLLDTELMTRLEDVLLKSDAIRKTGEDRRIFWFSTDSALSAPPSSAEAPQSSSKFISLPHYQILLSPFNQAYVMQLLLDSISGSQTFMYNETILQIFAFLLHIGFTFTLLDFFATSVAHSDQADRQSETVRQNEEAWRASKEQQRNGKLETIQYGGLSFLAPKNWLCDSHYPANDYGMRPYIQLDDIIYAHRSTKELKNSGARVSSALWERRVWHRLYEACFGSFAHIAAPYWLKFLHDEDGADLPLDEARIVFTYLTDDAIPLTLPTDQLPTAMMPLARIC